MTTYSIHMRRCGAALTIASSLILFNAAAAQTGTYVEGRIGVGLLSDSDNDGTFDGTFTTGEGTTIPAGTELPDGTAVGWTTEFDSGLAASLALGNRFGAMRGELELGYQSNDVDTHIGVVAGGIDLSTEDAGVLVTGADNLGVSVENLVADGQGELRTTYLMANGYYDFQNDSVVTPFIGAGIGFGFVDVEYAPSDVGIIDDDDTAFAYQVMLGASLDLGADMELVGAYRYRATTDVEVEATLFDADFEIENRSSIFEVGLRKNF